VTVFPAPLVDDVTRTDAGPSGGAACGVDLLVERHTPVPHKRIRLHLGIRLAEFMPWDRTRLAGAPRLDGVALMVLILAVRVGQPVLLQKGMPVYGAMLIGGGY
jgi:hypothetical protein